MFEMETVLNDRVLISEWRRDATHAPCRRRFSTRGWKRWKSGRTKAEKAKGRRRKRR